MGSMGLLESNQADRGRSQLYCCLVCIARGKRCVFVALLPSFGVKRLTPKCGLGQHKRHKHPAELNAERLAVLPLRKGERSDYDTQKLVNLANAMRLASKFAGRSAEGIKKRLIKVKWSEISKHGIEKNVPKPKGEIQRSSDGQTVVNIPSGDGNVRVVDVEHLEEERWRSSMLDTIINSLTKVNEP
ncbi:hypothetical protein P879_09374 [Paragonimus westermani]|uniref:Uncharacterized protein n=1 Tax=Paragonimus westermani TaxID=34504 RepID=A0A8T0DET6_9TREM|nr:hypothetical protein P879_09374 [Paragonimus westermani]